MNQIEVMKQALEALEAETDPAWGCNSYHPKIHTAITALRQAISKAEQAQPYADKAAMLAHMKDRIRIDPVTGNVGIGTPPQVEQAHPVRDYRTRYDRGCYKCKSHYCPSDCPEPEHLRQAVEQAQPVAVWQFRKRGCATWYDGRADHEDGGGPYEERTLYTAPLQRQPLTDEEIRKADHHMVDGAYHYSFKQGVRWAEHKHRIGKEKNT